MTENGRPTALAEISSPNGERIYSPEVLQRLGSYFDLISCSTSSVAFLITTTTPSRSTIEARFHKMNADTPFEAMHISGTLKKFENRGLIAKKILKRRGRIKSYHSLTPKGIEAISVATGFLSYEKE